MPQGVRVAVDQATIGYDKLYTYLWPQDLGTPVPGVRVLVPFGGGNRRRQGLVVEVAEPEDLTRVKPVHSRLDEEPLLSPELLALARFLQERTFCPLFDAVRAMVPTGLYMQLRPVLRTAQDIPPEVLETLTPNERQVIAFVSKCPEGADRATLLRRLGLDEDAPALRHLLEVGALTCTQDAFRRTGDATVRMVRLTQPEGEETSPSPKLTDRQQSVYRLLQDVGAASLREISYFTGVGPAVINALVKKGLAYTYDAEVLRAPYADAEEAPPLTPRPLSDEQQRAFDTLLPLLESRGPAAALLYGVTGSGKTAVYMQLIDRVIADGRQAIVLVPEISLTPQMMGLFLQRYGRRVAVLHSGLAIGERMDEWKRIRRGDAQIVVGTRSAVFAPCDRLGLIVMDEEQEHTYKSESSPRFHARDAARFRCARQGALLLLASATPSVESFYAAESGRYTLVQLKSRYGDVALPEVEVADMRQDPGADTAIGSVLHAAMRQCLDDGRQVILLLNRRGFNTNVSCRSCGQPIVCPSCSISMTYHRANGRLMCHYCGHSQPAPRVCPQCGSDKLRYAGQGTQLVEQQLAELFPDVPVLRMDTDTTMSRFAYEEKFKAFGEGRYRIMIGTQMVAKGLDFPQVGLVGVLSADQSLYGDDHRCYETTFSLLTQVVGRAGRRGEPGRAVIQTFTPDNPVIALAAAQDYDGFYRMEIAGRRMLHYPPYSTLVLFGLSGVREETVRQAGQWLLEQLRATATVDFPDVPLIALDPTPAAVLRVAGKYRYKMLIKTKNTARMRAMVRALLQAFYANAAFRGVGLFADIDPVSVL